jgi:hypothetical protein
MTDNLEILEMQLTRKQNTLDYIETEIERYESAQRLIKKEIRRLKEDIATQTLLNLGANDEAEV